MIELAIDEFDKQLQQESSRMDTERKKAAMSRRSLEQQLHIVAHGIQNIVKAIRDGREFGAVFQDELQQLESRPRSLKSKLDVSHKPLILAPRKDLRQYVLAKVEDLKAVLLGRIVPQPSARSNSTSESSPLHPSRLQPGRCTT